MTRLLRGKIPPSSGIDYSRPPCSISLPNFTSKPPVQGGSTLAVQLEKFRHSPHGRTESPVEKYRQFMGASLKAYREGWNTRAWRERIIVDYFNTVPLAAAPGYGEIHGLGEGLFAWFGMQLTEVVEALKVSGHNPRQTSRLQARPGTADLGAGTDRLPGRGASLAAREGRPVHPFDGSIRNHRLGFRGGICKKPRSNSFHPRRCRLNLRRAKTRRPMPFARLSWSHLVSTTFTISIVFMWKSEAPLMFRCKRPSPISSRACRTRRSSKPADWTASDFSRTPIRRK